MEMKSLKGSEQSTSLYMPGDGRAHNILSKTEYRNCLLQQIANERANKKREKDSRMSVAITGSVDPEKEPSRLRNLGNPIDYSRPNQPRNPKAPTLKPNETRGASAEKSNLKEFDSFQFDSIEAPNYQLASHGDDIVNSLSSILHRPHRIAGLDSTLPSCAIAPVTAFEGTSVTQPPSVPNKKMEGSGRLVDYYQTDCGVNKKKYNADLINQMRDNTERKRKQMESELREDMLAQMEQEKNSPWGKAGAGAPLQTTPNLPRKTVHESPPEKAPVQTNAYGEVTFARGGHSIFGTPKTDLEKLTAERYRKDLERQIEDQRVARRTEVEKIRAEEEREMRQIREYNERVKQREEEERRQQLEKERTRLEKNQQELEMRRHQFEERKRVYRTEEIKPFRPPEMTPPPKRPEMQLERNKQNKLLERLDAFRSQLNSKKDRFEHSRKAVPPRPGSNVTVTCPQDYEILSDFWKISELDEESDKLYYDSPPQFETKPSDRRLVKKMKNLREKIMGDQDPYPKGLRDNLEIEEEWLNPGVYDL